MVKSGNDTMTTRTELIEEFAKQRFSARLYKERQIPAMALECNARADKLRVAIQRKEKEHERSSLSISTATA